MSVESVYTLRMGKKRSETCADQHSVFATKAAYARWERQSAPLDELGEEWRDVPSHPGYQASSWGRVRSRHTLLKPHARRSGHLYVAPSFGGRQAPAAVHTMVCEAFHGPRPPEAQCRHLDGVPSNNKPSNLTWGTQLENQRDRIVHGTSAAGERNGRSKLTDEQVAVIRRRAASGERREQIAAEYGITQGHVSNIKTGGRRSISARAWKPPKDVGARTTPGVAAAVALVAAGMKTTDAAKQAGANLTSVRCRVSELRRIGFLPKKTST